MMRSSPLNLSLALAALLPALPAHATGASTDVFAPGSCRGPAMGSDKAFDFLDLPAGVLQRDIARVELHMRQRRCYPGVACGAWSSEGPSVSASADDLLGEDFSTSPAHAYDSRILTGGVLRVAYRSNQVVFELVGDRYRESWGDIFTASHRYNHLRWGSFAPGAAARLSPRLDWERHENRGCPNGHCEGTYLAATGSEAVYFQGSAEPLTVVGLVADRCARFAASQRQEQVDERGNRYTLESELVVHGTVIDP